MSATQKPRARRASRDTGFPEPFDQFSNTTLPHPDADLSPNACITHDEKAGDVIMTRRKRMPTGLLHRSKTRHAANNGFAEPSTDVFSSLRSLALPESRSSEKESGGHQSLSRTSSATCSSVDGSESVAAPREDEMSPPTSPESVRSFSKRGSLFSKFKR